MAEIITLQSAVLPILQAAAQKIADTYGGSRSDENEWMVRCPLHDDEHASCHIKIQDKLLVYCHVCGKEKQAELIQKLKNDNLWVAVETTQKKKDSDVVQSNIPAHDVPPRFPQFLTADKINYPVTKIWTYRTAEGQPAFWIIRGDSSDPKAKRRKLIMPMSSFTIDGKDVFKYRLQCNKRPLYNLPAILNDMQRTVIVVEGEKAADGAKEAFKSFKINDGYDKYANPINERDKYVITTWAFGAKSVRFTDISPLLDREVILWPDNDKTGIEGMMEAARYLPNAFITFQEVQESLPLKWDLGDPIPPNIDIESIIEKAHPPSYKDANFEEISLEELKKQWQKMEDGGGTTYVDTYSRSHSRPPEMPFRLYNSKAKLQEAEPLMETSLVNGKLIRIKAIDKYIDDKSQKIAVGFTFDPTKADVRIERGESLYLNTFMGFEHSATECDATLYRPFLDHINGVFNEHEANWLLDFFADLFQNIGWKPGVMPIITGKPGTGKSIIGEVITAILGRRIAICIPCGAVFDSKFNGMLAHKVFVSFDELNLYGATNKHANENLKTLVTDSHVSINEKYMKQKAERSYHRFMGTTNIDMPVTIDMNDRRYILLTAGDRFINNVDHFYNIVKMMRDSIALSGLAYYFKNRQITNNVRIVMQTEARALVQRPEDPIMDIFFSWLNEAHIPEEVTVRLSKAEWPEKKLYVPRSLICEYIKRKHPSLSATRITQKLLQHLKYDHPEGKYNNTKRMTINSLNRNGVEEINERVFEFKPVHEQRAIYERITNTKPKWEDISFDVSEPKENILEFPAGREPF